MGGAGSTGGSVSLSGGLSLTGVGADLEFISGSGVAQSSGSIRMGTAQSLISSGELQLTTGNAVEIAAAVSILAGSSSGSSGKGGAVNVAAGVGSIGGSVLLSAGVASSSDNTLGGAVTLFGVKGVTLATEQTWGSLSSGTID